MQNKKISVCINTKNRPHQLKECLQGLVRNQLRNYEIIIIDQSDDLEMLRVNKKLNKHPQVKYFQNKERGVGRAKNFVLTKTTGKIIAFTDDDCIVNKNWLENIVQTFQENKDIVGVFGKVFPYRPTLHRGKICPCSFLNKQKKTVAKPCFHAKNIGFGNNMAFKREIFEKVGGFKEWLGPGSIGSNAEDAEFALRVLLKGYKILYNPKVKVYHNRWLTKEEFRKQQLSYACGEVACYGYFAFQGKKFAKKVVINNFKDSYWKLRKAIKLILLKRRGFRSFLHTLEELFSRLRGLIVAFYFSKKNHYN